MNHTLPAPIGGINARDSMDMMPETDALVMDNYIPSETTVSLRNGYTEYASFNSRVRTLAEYKKPQNNRFIAVADNGIYDISSREFVKISEPLASSICQFRQYKDRLFLVNGMNTPKVFKVDDNFNNVVEDWGFTAETLEESKIINVGVSKQRLWFVEKSTLKAWYPSEAGNIAGELKQFDLSMVSRFGGELVAVEVWTQDGGQGIDDLTVFVTSEGEVIVYAGSNPNDAGDWAMKGSYKLPRPIGYKCTMQYQGDVIIITEDGYLPLSNALPLQMANASKIAFSDKIRGLVLSKTRDNKNISGWQSVIYYRGGYALFNVPNREQFEQHVINTATGAWGRFTGIRSFCWGIFGDRLYFGSDDGVYLFDDGHSDNGDYISGVIEQAYSNLGNPNLKSIPLLNPRTKSSTRFALTIYTNMDFERRNLDYVESVGGVSNTKWSSLSKPNGTKWSSLAKPIGTKWATLKNNIGSQWISNNATGFKASLVFKTRTRGNIIELHNTGVRYIVGSGLL